MSPRTFSVASATALALASVSIAAPSHALDGIELPIDTEVTSPLAGAVTIDARSVLAAGRITDSNGLPARGVPVTAYAYPSKIPAEVGFKFELTPVGTTVTDSSGNYQIRTDTAALRPMAAEVSEALDIQQGPAPVNVDIIAGTGNAMTSYATTVWATPDLRQAHVAAVDLPAATVGIVDETRAAAAMHDAVRTPQLSEGLGSTCPSTPARR